MAYVPILDVQIEPEKPVTTSLVAALRDNPLAIAQGDASAPRIKPVSFILREQQTSGTVPTETFPAGTDWIKRTLNTTVVNDISGASVASSQITLPAGTYRVDGSAPQLPSSGSSAHKLRLRNITDGTTALVGRSERVTVSTSLVNARITGQFTIAATKVFELQNYGGQSNAGGSASSSGEVEVYTEISITKVV